MSNAGKSIRVVGTIVIITVIVKLLGFLRILLMARSFGTGIEASAFEAAYRIPDLLFTSIGVALSTSFIPVFNEYLGKSDNEKAVYFANNVVNILAAVTIVLSLIGMLSAPYIVRLIYTGFKGDIYYLTVNLVRIMFPIIFFIAISFTYVGILQSYDEYNIPAAISLPANLINIAYLVFFSTRFGIYGFAIAVLLGWSTQVLIQVPALIKKGYRYTFDFSLKDSGVKKMLIMVVPVILGTAIQQINSFVSGGIASNLGENAVSALGYANYLYIIIVGVFTYAVSAVVFPSLSKMHASENYTEFKGLINRAIKSVIYILFPMMVGVMILNVPIIRVLLQRGKFDYNSTLLTSSALFYYALGMLGFGISEIFNRGFYAIHNTKTPMKISALGMALNIILSIALSKYLGLGGLALATSIASIVIAALLVIRLASKIPNLIEKNTFSTFFKVAFSSLVMGVIVVAAYKLIGINPVQNTMRVLLGLCISIFSGIIAYCMITLLLKVDESVLVFEIIKRNVFKLVKGREV